MRTVSVSQYLKTAARSLWKQREFFVEDGNYDVVLQCLMLICDSDGFDSEYTKEYCILALDEVYSEEVG